MLSITYKIKKAKNPENGLGALFLVFVVAENILQIILRNAAKLTFIASIKV